jgi:aspartate carbamoyltransferase catalytic subunit
MKHLISAADFTREWLEMILDQAETCDNTALTGTPLPQPNHHKAVFFFGEASTRTCDSYDEAGQMLRLRLKTISGKEGTSLTKGEALSAFGRMEAGYNAGVLVMRMPIEGGARWMSEMYSRHGLRTAVHNAGDGINQHPSQALLDLLTIKRKLGRLSDLSIGFVGDLKNSRTIHSLIQALWLFPNIKIVLVSSAEVTLQPWYLAGHPDVVVSDSIEALRDCDIVYVTRVQRERFGNPLDYDRVRGRYVVNASALEMLGPKVLIMHPQPVADGEVHPEVWLHPQVIMDEQARLGVPARMAALLHSLESLDEATDISVPEPNIREIRRGSIAEAVRAKADRERYFLRISEGTVIDHLPFGVGSQVRVVLRSICQKQDGVVVLTEGIESHHLASGRKDTLVLAHRYLDPEQMAAVWVLAPDATFNVFREGQFIKQRVVHAEVITVGRCPNTNCITRLDPQAARFPRFRVFQEAPVIQCHYCEQVFNKNEVFV